LNLNPPLNRPTDVSLILEEHKDIILGHIHGTPDLICEILSDSTRERHPGIKADRYLFNGVKEYWIVDPSKKTIQVWLNHGKNWDKKSGEILASELLPGLQISIDDIFLECHKWACGTPRRNPAGKARSGNYIKPLRRNHVRRTFPKINLLLSFFKIFKIFKYST